MIRGLFLAAALAAFGCGARGAEMPGTITILEGPAQVFRGAGRLHAAEGLRLAAGDIVETEGATFVQIELPDQSVLQLGPATRVLVGAPAPRQKSERTLYVLAGWTKLIGARREGNAAPGYELRSAQLDIPSNPAVVVLRALPAETHLFVERGDVRLAERQSSGNALVVAMQAGDHYVRRPGARGAINPGSMAAFLGAMPRQFRDSLPRRIDRFREREVQAAAAPDFSYADVEPWLKEPSLRRAFVQRWRGKARDSAFRASLVANLAAHPEWDPVLFPEKYLPKEPPRRAAAVPASGTPPYTR